MSWERQKAQMAKMSPEELAEFKAKRSALQRAAWKRRTDKKRANGELPPEPIRGRPRPTKAQIAAEAAAEEAKRAERREQYAAKRAEQKRLRREDDRKGSLDEFLAQGAQDRGFSAFLRSKEIKIADQITRAKGDVAA